MQPVVHELQSESEVVVAKAPLTPCNVSINKRSHLEKVVQLGLKNPLVLEHALVGLSGMSHEPS